MTWFDKITKLTGLSSQEAMKSRHDKPPFSKEASPHVEDAGTLLKEGYCDDNLMMNGNPKKTSKANFRIKQ